LEDGKLEGGKVEKFESGKVEKLEGCRVVSCDVTAMRYEEAVCWKGYKVKSGKVGN
jgi:hypothetical protein